MQQFIDTAAKSLGISESAARSATGGILEIIQEEIPSGDFMALLRKVPGAFDLVSESSTEPTSGGGLMSTLAGVAASTVLGEIRVKIGVLGRMKRSGIDPGQAGSLVTMLVGFLRDKAGADLVSRVLGGVPELKQFIQS